MRVALPFNICASCVLFLSLVSVRRVLVNLSSVLSLRRLVAFVSTDTPSCWEVLDLLGTLLEELALESFAG